MLNYLHKTLVENILGLDDAVLAATHKIKPKVRSIQGTKYAWLTLSTGLRAIVYIKSRKKRVTGNQTSAINLLIIFGNTIVTFGMLTLPNQLCKPFVVRDNNQLEILLPTTILHNPARTHTVTPCNKFQPISVSELPLVLQRSMFKNLISYSNNYTYNVIPPITILITWYL